MDYTDFTVDQYFSQRFSLCVLDTIRRLQNRPNFNGAVEICHIIEAVQDRCFIDGDVTSQVMAAIQDLESAGFVMRGPNGVRTLGPFAKLSLAKTQKQRRLMWKKIETGLGIGTDSRKDLISEAKKYRKFLNSRECFIPPADTAENK